MVFFVVLKRFYVFFGAFFGGRYCQYSSRVFTAEIKLIPADLVVCVNVKTVPCNVAGIAAVK